VADERISRAPHRYSGRTAMRANIDVHEPKPPADADAPFSFTMEGYYGRAQLPSALVPFFWAPAWNSVQSVNKFQDEIAGPLHGGDPGVRLLEPSADARAEYSQSVPEAFVPRKDAWRVVPLHHIFGDEELSAGAPAIAERLPTPYVALHPDDAAALGLTQGDSARVELGEAALDLAVRARAGLARGTVGLPVGLPDLIGVPGASWARLSRSGST
jgi:NADH-quinone oxidoreductase subunit G